MKNYLVYPTSIEHNLHSVNYCKSTPTACVNSCSRFLYLDGYVQGDEELRRAVKNIKSETKLINLLREAIGGDEDWAMLGSIGSHTSNQVSFEQRNYGFKKFSDLFAAIELFESKVTHGSVI